jgi:hypothetical protein
MRCLTRKARRSRADALESDARVRSRGSRRARARSGGASTWTRAELMRHIKVSLPAAELGTDPRAAIRLMNEPTRRSSVDRRLVIQEQQDASQCQMFRRCGMRNAQLRRARGVDRRHLLVGDCHRGDRVNQAASAGARDP